MTLLSTPTKSRLFSTLFKGRKIYVSGLINRPIIITTYDFATSRFNNNKQMAGMQIIIDGEQRLCMTESYTLIDTLRMADKANLPFYTKIVRKKDGYYYFVKLNAFELDKIKR